MCVSNCARFFGFETSFFVHMPQMCVSINTIRNRKIAPVYWFRLVFFSLVWTAMYSLPKRRKKHPKLVFHSGKAVFTCSAKKLHVRNNKKNFPAFFLLSKQKTLVKKAFREWISPHKRIFLPEKRQQKKTVLAQGTKLKPTNEIFFLSLHLSNQQRFMIVQSGGTFLKRWYPPCSNSSNWSVC